MAALDLSKAYDRVSHYGSVKQKLGSWFNEASILMKRNKILLLIELFIPRTKLFGM